MSQNNPPRGLELLVGAIIVCALATARNFERLKVLLAQLAYGIALFSLQCLKLAAIAALIFGVCYGIYKLGLRIRKIVLLVSDLEKRTKEIEGDQLPDLWRWVHGLKGRIDYAAVNIDKFEAKLLTLETDAKKAKENPTTAIAAVVSQLTKG